MKQKANLTHEPDFSKKFKDHLICIKGAGDLATGVAVCLYRAGFYKIVMLEIAKPLAVRRGVAFSEAIFLSKTEVEGVQAVLLDAPDQLQTTWESGKIAVVVDPEGTVLNQEHFHVVIDAIIAKRNLNTSIQDAPLVVALGPGFTAGLDTNFVIETHRGNSLGKIIKFGKALENTGIPGVLMGYDKERVLKSPQDGNFTTNLNIGNSVKKSQIVGYVAGEPVIAQLDGVIRGLLRTNTFIQKGTKLGDIDPRIDKSLCHLISDKANLLGESVLTVILEEYRKNKNKTKKNGITLWQ